MSSDHTSALGHAPSGARIVRESAAELSARWKRSALDEARAAGRAEAEEERIATAARGVVLVRRRADATLANRLEVL